MPILLYHHIGILADGAGGEWANTTISAEGFEEQMAYLANHGYRTVQVIDVVDALAGRKTLPAKPVVVSFDDGWIDCYESAFPVLRKYGLTGTFFIAANWVERGMDDVMSWTQILQMSNTGMEIGSHSMTHPYLTQSDGRMLGWELEASKAMLEERMNWPVEVLAYPFGLYDSNVMTRAEEAGYRGAVTIDEGWVVSGDNPFEMPRVTVRYGTDLETFKRMLGE